MPELPEVETTLRGLAPFVVGAKIAEVIVRKRELRQPVSDSIHDLEGQRIESATRRSKYLLLAISDHSTLLIHLGMSGSLRIATASDPWKKHDHVAMTFTSGRQIRFHDPRRFGLVLRLTETDPLTHPLLRMLGPEPLENDFDLKWLITALKSRNSAIKAVLMDAKVVVGVGNIYASEALFRAGILPKTKASKVTRPRLVRLIAAIRSVLNESILEGGTTLRDFIHSDGKPGYFKQRLFVYGRKAEPCRICQSPIRHQVLAQRSTYWCSVCQK